MKLPLLFACNYYHPFFCFPPFSFPFRENQILLDFLGLIFWDIDVSGWVSSCCISFYGIYRNKTRLRPCSFRVNWWKYPGPVHKVEQKSGARRALLDGLVHAGDNSLHTALKVTPLQKSHRDKPPEKSLNPFITLIISFILLQKWFKVSAWATLGRLTGDLGIFWIFRLFFFLAVLLQSRWDLYLVCVPVPIL